MSCILTDLMTHSFNFSKLFSVCGPAGQLAELRARDPPRRPAGMRLIKYNYEATTKEVLFDTKGQYMKVSNTLEGNATIKEQQKKIFFDAKGQ